MASEYFTTQGVGAEDDEGDYDEGLDLDEEGMGDADDAAADALKKQAENPFEALYEHHPETILDYAETIMPAVPLKVASPGGEKDPQHMSPPFLTVYERTKLLGMRANQIAEGAKIYVDRPEHVVEPLEIAKMELEQRRLPYIIKRPMPDGSFEYWRLSDLMIL
jgi:DNA-directed RNA polymerase I, II, and III subunit RPABC2